MRNKYHKVYNIIYYIKTRSYFWHPLLAELRKQWLNSSEPATLKLLTREHIDT